MKFYRNDLEKLNEFGKKIKNWQTEGYEVSELEDDNKIIKKKLNNKTKKTNFIVITSIIVVIILAILTVDSIKRMKKIKNLYSESLKYVEKNEFNNTDKPYKALKKLSRKKGEELLNIIEI